MFERRRACRWSHLGARPGRGDQDDDHHHYHNYPDYDDGNGEDHDLILIGDPYD